MQDVGDEHDEERQGHLKGRVGIPLEEDVGEREEELSGDDEDHPEERAGAEVVVPIV